ncbi:MAG: helix-turn-helix domain-containing protein [Ardenticatenales bacterium]|nr:helix-turn-helix domain-containing protein [Ardenticatenales bacterium]
MTNIGVLLRTTREEQGLSLEEVEKGTRIRARFLEALEENDFDSLGGDVYLRGFLRNYATYLGVDPTPLLAELAPVHSPALPKVTYISQESHYLSEPLQSNPVPFGRIFSMLLIGALVMALAYFIWWQPAAQRDAFLEQLGTLLPSAGPTAPPTTLPGAPTRTPGSTVVTQTMVIVPFQSPTPVGQPTAVPTASLPPRTPTPDLNVTPTVPLPTPTAPAPIDGVVVTAQVLSATWVRVVIDAQNQPAVERVLSPGETFEWVGTQEVRLRVGNAAGLQISLNGQQIGVLGQAGEVLERLWRRNPDGGLPILVDPQS